MPNEEQIEGLNLPNKETRDALIVAALNGATVADLTDTDPELLEQLYALGYNLYNTGNYANAEKIFRALCIYKGNEYRFALGLAGCFQAQNKFDQAIEVYSLAGIISGLNQLAPFFYAAHCYLKKGDKENAIIALQSLIEISAEGDENNAIKEKASQLLQLLEQAPAEAKKA